MVDAGLADFEGIELEGVVGASVAGWCFEEPGDGEVSVLLGVFEQSASELMVLGLVAMEVGEVSVANASCIFGGEVTEVLVMGDDGVVEEAE